MRSLFRLSSWAALQHTGTGILLAAALIAGGGVEGGVVAYQLAMVVFLAPYGIVAQPIHTAVLPRLATEVQQRDTDGLHASVRWASDAMVAATMPVAALLTALSAPVMAVLAFGEAAEGDGPELLGAALVGLAVGIPLYGGFLLLTRVAYALGDSRTPAVASLAVAVLGGAGMLIGGGDHGGSRHAGAGRPGPQRGVRPRCAGAGRAAAPVGRSGSGIPPSSDRLRSRAWWASSPGPPWSGGRRTVASRRSWRSRVVSMAAMAIYAGGLRLFGAVPPAGPDSPGGAVA